MMGTIHLVNDRDIDFAVLTCLDDSENGLNAIASKFAVGVFLIQ